jgi:hypothetical protein
MALLELPTTFISMIVAGRLSTTKTVIVVKSEVSSGGA